MTGPNHDDALPVTGLLSDPAALPVTRYDGSALWRKPA